MIMQRQMTQLAGDDDDDGDDQVSSIDKRWSVEWKLSSSELSTALLSVVLE